MKITKYVSLDFKQEPNEVIYTIGVGDHTKITGVADDLAEAKMLAYHLIDILATQLTGAAKAIRGGKV